VPLSHGDVLVMCGSMQDTYEHGVRSTSRKAYAGESRINVTVRAFKPGSDAVRE
jgi:alkylated DNA repair dioxygenase AlkB